MIKYLWHIFFEGHDWSDWKLYEEGHDTSFSGQRIGRYYKWLSVCKKCGKMRFKKKGCIE